jgi:ubiquinone/menaquinone biosynthesis C-methylase UbiE
LPLPELPSEVLAHYARTDERGRLFSGTGPLERARSEDLIRRHLPPPPARILDVGGGPATYACWLAREGYEVHLVDPVAKHVAEAREASARQADRPLASARVGDARALEEGDASADALLLMGPLYHLQERADRLGAWREAFRVLRRGGLVLAVGISRYASLLDGLATGSLDDPAFAAIVEGDLRDGRHINRTENDAYFTTAYLHHPDELSSEARAAGFEVLELVGLEGPGWLFADFEARWADPAGRDRLLKAARALEHEPALLAVSAHLMLAARRPA